MKLGPRLIKKAVDTLVSVDHVRRELLELIWALRRADPEPKKKRRPAHHKPSAPTRKRRPKKHNTKRRPVG